MLDLAVAYNRYKFLGYEFLTWLWFIVEQNQDIIGSLEEEPASLAVGDLIILKNKLDNNEAETVTIKGDDADLEEAKLALRKGAVVTELNLTYYSDDYQWRFTIKGESLNITGIHLPATGSAESKEDIEGVVIEKAFLYEKSFNLIDALFKQFINIRITSRWENSVVPLIKKWLHL